MEKENCVFCKIVDGSVPSYTVWQDEKHMAFLSIFPNTEGVTVVIPKAHLSSYIFDLPENDINELMSVSKKVANILVDKFEDISRCAVVFEGFGVNHLHAKLFPMHGAAGMGEWKAVNSNMEKYFDKYEGYISSHDCHKESHENLQKTLDKILN